jgi:hypothetical protein
VHSEKFKDFPEPEDNVENYRKIIKVLLNSIGVSSSTSHIPSNEGAKTLFVDPGYNDDPKSVIGNFIQSNANKGKKTDNKKVIIGPGQAKQKAAVEKTSEANNDFLSLDILGSGSMAVPTAKPHEEVNLLNGSVQGNQLSYDEMLGGFNFDNSKTVPQPSANTNDLI